MAFIRVFLRTCFILLGVGVIHTHAEEKEKTASLSMVQKQLLATRYISLVELSPDKKNLLLMYKTPQISLSKDILNSKWVNTLAIKCNYDSEKALTTEFSVKNPIYSPTWTVDSKWVSYISKGDKFLSLWISPPQEFKPQKVLELENDILDYQWSPDGKKLAILADIPFSPDPVKIDYQTNRTSRFTIYILDVNEKMEVSNSTPLTSDNIVFANGRSRKFSWTPDSQGFIISHIPMVNGKKAGFSQISLISISTHQVQTIEKGVGIFRYPFVSPDGKYVAYATNDLPENAQNPIAFYEMGASRICITDLKSYEKTCLAKTPNEIPFLVGWGKDSHSLFVQDKEGNADHIYELGIDGKTLRRLTQNEQALSSVCLNSSRDMISYVAEDLKTPSEAYVTSLSPFDPKKVIPALPSLLKSDFSVEKVQWKSKDNKFNLEGLFIYPKTGAASFPLVTILHDYFSEFSLGYIGNLNDIPLSYAAFLEKGYALFIPSRRGTNGYGVQFRQAIFKNLGDGDYEDVMSGIDHILKEKKNIDPQKLALWGWGYGGYLTAWALTHTDRFKTLVIGQGIADLIFQIGTTDSPNFLKAIMGGSYWDDWKMWQERSPLSYIKEGKTPTFLQYGSSSLSIRSSHGIEIYFPLKTLGVPVKMVSYLEQGSSFSSPHITLQALQDLEDWLDVYLNPQPQDRKGK